MDEPSSAVLKVDKIPVTDSTVGGYVALATINRPNKLNALNVDVMDSSRRSAHGWKIVMILDV